MARPGILLSEEYHGNSAFALRHGLPIATSVAAAPLVHAPLVHAPLAYAQSAYPPSAYAPLVHTPLVHAPEYTYAHSYGYDDLLGYSAY